MPIVTFGYESVPLAPSAAFPQGQVVLRPIRTVHVNLPEGPSIDWRACLDTGADRCVFPMSLADSLGLDKETMPQETTLGATGSGDVYYADVCIAIPFRLDGRLYMPSFETRAGFTEGLEDMGLGLLGQIGFFDKYPVLFNQPGNAFTIDFGPDAAPGPPAVQPPPGRW